MTTAISYLHSPVGYLRLEADNEGLQSLLLNNPPVDGMTVTEPLHPILVLAHQQLHEYFNGTRQEFSVPLSMAGTEFQLSAWHALRTIPYGKTVSYKMIAEQIGRPKAMRAVGMANNRNPIAIIVPCHRVIGANGQLVGYAGGLGMKQWLLDHETQYAG
ncbi:methylated-DNA--[protein]-cysteine S-methyltransferase [Tolumonas lignilytica]|jgi:O-6-methylguanine DNA methyltransferase|uniref:methylated-DNA--[protein]-cysteine S-methyltransferase n=1 Tax=Tolumonas lignilytica TaxID=1283284 RepID=UPI0004643D83|nr:methylated-DNA--[protein]-cysteine S-methyltransferase [Tolumonas lignilytica]